MMNFLDPKNRNILLGLTILSCCLCLSCSKDKIVEPDLAGVIIKVPSEMPTIQAAVNAAEDGDTILVAPGIYRGEGNRDITITGKSVTILSETGCANTTIDCQGTDTAQHRAFFISGQSSSNTIIEGFTIKGGYSSSGAAVYCKSSSPTLISCVFTNNQSSVSGGAIRCKEASPSMINCTFVANSAGIGGAIFGLAKSSPYLQDCIIAFSSKGESIVISDAGSQPLLVCCNIFGNVDGDWVGSISDQANSEGNLSVDPLFCDFDNSLFFIDPSSPCAPNNNSCGSLIGALPAECN